MSLFKRIMGGGGQAEEPSIAQNKGVQGATLAVMVSAMVGDGEVNDAELIQLTNICALSPIFKEHSADAINDMAKAIVEEIGAKGHESVIKQAAEILAQPLRETAFAFAVRMVVADGVINQNEVDAINAIGRWLDVDQAVGEKILAVNLIMQRAPEPKKTS